MPGDNGSSVLERLYERLLFLTQFLRQPKRLGVPVAMCREAGDRVREELVAREPRTVIELGAGLGALTEGILEALPAGERLLCVEQNKTFCRRLRKRYTDRVRVVQGDALDVRNIAADTRWERPDAVVSSVPLFGQFGRDLCRTVAEFLPEDSLYLQVTNMRDRVAQHFDIRQSYLFMENLPPEQLHAAVKKNGNGHDGES